MSEGRPTDRQSHVREDILARVILRRARQTSDAEAKAEADRQAQKELQTKTEQFFEEVLPEVASAALLSNVEQNFYINLGLDVPKHQRRSRGWLLSQRHSKYQREIPGTQRSLSYDGLTIATSENIHTWNTIFLTTDGALYSYETSESTRDLTAGPSGAPSSCILSDARPINDVHKKEELEAYMVAVEDFILRNDLVQAMSADFHGLPVNCP